jgi:hypothetical protein
VRLLADRFSGTSCDLASWRPSERQHRTSSGAGEAWLGAFDRGRGRASTGCFAGEPKRRARPWSSWRYSGPLRLERMDFGDAEKASSKRCEEPHEMNAASAEHVATGDRVLDRSVFAWPDGPIDLGMILRALTRPHGYLEKARARWITDDTPGSGTERLEGSRERRRRSHSLWFRTSRNRREDATIQQDCDVRTIPDARCDSPRVVRPRSGQEGGFEIGSGMAPFGSHGWYASAWDPLVEGGSLRVTDKVARCTY